MLISARFGNNLHAPENSRISLISAYTSGADILEVAIQYTKDEKMVLCSSNFLKNSTGEEGKISDKTLEELYRLDFSQTFRPRHSTEFSFYRQSVAGRRLSVETLPEILRLLPREITLLIKLDAESIDDKDRREHFVNDLARVLTLYKMSKKCILYSSDIQLISSIVGVDSKLQFAVYAPEASQQKQFELLRNSKASGIVTNKDLVFNSENRLTEFGEELSDFCIRNQLPIGVVLHLQNNGSFTEADYLELNKYNWVWALSTDSFFDIESFTRNPIPFVNESFEGQTLKRSLFAFGYAKANHFAKVFQDNGVHIEIQPYSGNLEIPEQQLDRRLYNIETKLMYTAKDWPFYSGGGLGVLEGIVGDFVAEIDYSVKEVAQATTLEMAVINVDPGAHRDTSPVSFRDKDSFYDPHGAPPFVGVEHDENDGYRINWNLGSEYDSNQYGRPVGNGWDAHSARLRLERRGVYFSAYYKNNTDAHDWVCVGVTRNDSMNRRVFLRCVGKRWRQEDDKNTDEYYPIIANHFVFKNLKINLYA